MDEPVCYSQAKKEKSWEKAMTAEIEAIERNGTWNLVELPAGHRAIVKQPGSNPESFRKSG